MIIIASTTLLLFLSPIALPPTDPTTGKLIEHANERINFLIKNIEQRREKIIVPTPALAEVLVRAGGAAESYVEIINKRHVFRVISFDARAAIEHAIMTRQAIRMGDKKGGIPESWVKVKFDRQIVAIAKAYGVTELYSDDLGIRSLGTVNGLQVIGLSDCPMPPELAQKSFALGEDRPSETQNIGRISRAES